MDSAFFYTQLMFEVSQQTKLISATSIDLKFVLQNFDKILLDSSNKFEDAIFVIHPNIVCDLTNEVTDINKAIQHVETFPFWSRKWIEIQGIFGYSSSSDGYTGLVEYFLHHDYGIDRRIGANVKLIEETHGGFVDSTYWQGPRRTAMEMHLSPQSIAFARQAAKNLALNITNAWSKDDYTKYLIQATLNNYDKNLLLERENYWLKHQCNAKVHTNNTDTIGDMQRMHLARIAKKKKIIRRILRALFPPLMVYDFCKKYL